ncbi:MAG: zinc ribbon domain-containing protein [Blastocatellia bacterium]
MFCPNCGAEYAQKINYCKRCGATMTTPTNTVEVNVPRPRLTGLFWAVAIFSLIGLGACFSIYTHLADRGLREEHLFIPFVFGLFFVFGVSALLIWQLARTISVFRDAVRTPKIEPAGAAAISAAATRYTDRTSKQHY